MQFYVKIARRCANVCIQNREDVCIQSRTCLHAAGLKKTGVNESDTETDAMYSFGICKEIDKLLGVFS